MPISEVRHIGHTSGPRDGFLDVVRGIATMRVIVWHAIGLPIVSYLIAAMPAMFFVSGDLFAASADRRSPTAVLLDRLRRIVLPLWFFVTVVWSVLAWRTASDGLPWRELVWWLIPVVDPPAMAAEGGWISSPLWFLRALLWILLLAPVLMRAVRRAPRLTVGAGVALVVGFDLLDRTTALSPTWAPKLGWHLGDVALYGTFFLAGAYHHAGGFTGCTRRRWLTSAAVAATASAAWAVTQPVPMHVVNNSHALHLLVGVAWLSLAFAVRAPLASLAERRRTAPVVLVLSRRSLTIYLWHTTAIILALRYLDAAGMAPGWLRSLSYAALIGTGTAVAVALFGWVEDLAARRPAVLWPHRAPGRPGLRVRPWHPVLAVAVVVAVVTTQTSGVTPSETDTVAAATVTEPRRPPIPSQQPPRPQFTTPAQATDAAIDATVDSAVVDLAVSRREFGDELQRLIDTWATDHNIAGVVAGVRLHTGAGDEWVRASGTQPDGTPATADDVLETLSATKLFTASLVYRAVDAGLIDLDAPLPRLSAVPDFPYNNLLTPRVLLMHRSGLVNYRDTPTYIDDPSSVVSAADAVRASMGLPLEYFPGTDANYSSTNYLILGLLLEDATGRSFERLFQEGVIDKFGLSRSTHAASEPGSPHHATAGLLGPMSDLLVATEAVLTGADGVSEHLQAVRMDVDPDNAMGAGTFGFCPCDIGPDDQRHYFGVGYTGSHTWLAYIPSLDLTVGVDVYDSFSLDGRYEATNELATIIAQAASRIIDDPFPDEMTVTD